MTHTPEIQKAIESVMRVSNVSYEVAEARVLPIYEARAKKAAKKQTASFQRKSAAKWEIRRQTDEMIDKVESLTDEQKVAFSEQVQQNTVAAQRGMKRPNDVAANFNL
jgi:hypothetical protein